MSGIRSVLFVGLLLTCELGCELTAELGAYSGAEAASESDGRGDGSGGTETGGESGETGDWDPDDGDGTCVLDGSESLCRTCLEQLCCEELENCNGEPSCFCMLECLAVSDAVTCAMDCTPGTAYFELLQCRSASCADVCD